MSGKRIGLWIVRLWLLTMTIFRSNAAVQGTVIA